jgi:hypothetical protein
MPEWYHRNLRDCETMPVPTELQDIPGAVARTSSSVAGGRKLKQNFDVCSDVPSARQRRLGTNCLRAPDLML